MHKYRIKFSHLAAKELEKIYKIQKRLCLHILAAIETLRLNPFQGKKLRGKLKNNYSLRVGDCRVIYLVRKDELIIYVIDVGHRREIYQ